MTGGRPLQGHPEPLTAYRGRVVFVNFWASWCHPCKKEAPQLVRFAKSLRPGDVALIGVDVTDGRQAALGFIRKFGVRYTITADPSATIAGPLPHSRHPDNVCDRSGGADRGRLLGPQTVSSLRRVLAEVEG